MARAKTAKTDPNSFALHGLPCPVCQRPASRHYPLLGLTEHESMWMAWPCRTKPAQRPVEQERRAA
jgi:hypothetical protein